MIPYYIEGNAFFHQSFSAKTGDDTILDFIFVSDKDIYVK